MDSPGNSRGSDPLNALWALVARRLDPREDRARVDDEIWTRFGSVCGVLFTDLAGFSRRVEEFGIVHFLQTILESRRFLDPLVAEHGGTFIKSDGDSILAVFPASAPDKEAEVARATLECAVAMRAVAESLNQRRSESDKILLCVGLGFGRILRAGDLDVFGPEVNAAAKLGEDVARSGEILATGGFLSALGAGREGRFAPIEASVPGSKSAYRLER